MMKQNFIEIKLVYNEIITSFISSIYIFNDVLGLFNDDYYERKMN